RHRSERSGGSDIRRPSRGSRGRNPPSNGKETRQRGKTRCGRSRTRRGNCRGTRCPWHRSPNSGLSRTGRRFAWDRNGGADPSELPEQPLPDGFGHEPGNVPPEPGRLFDEPARDVGELFFGPQEHTLAPRSHTPPPPPPLQLPL